MYHVVKRDGSVVEFDISKIAIAIQKAFDSLAMPYNQDIIDFLALKTTAHYADKIRNDSINVEDIQDSVEHVLSEAGYAEVAKAYILYRKKREQIRNTHKSLLDYKKLVDDYLKTKDWRVKENSTVSYSLGGFILSNSGAITANYWLNDIYDKEIADAHRSCDFHIHDLSMMTPYCFTGDTKILVPHLNGSPTDWFRITTFAELVENKMDKVSVFAYNKATRKTTIALGINPRITRRVDGLEIVELSNGAIIKCTPDHPFMLADGRYDAARDLKPGDLLKTVTVGRNSSVSVKTVRYEPHPELVDVYDLTVPEFENFAIAGNIFVHNCAGWNLKQLIQEGLGGVPGKITSKPAAHLTTLCNQMVNFFGILQNEWAGAQAFSSFDTYLAPFVKVDNLDYAQVKQAIQMFCFGVNTPSRWGCVDTDTEVLSVDGFKKYNELQEGDEIYVWVKGALETRPVQKVVIKEHRGKMHSYRLETDTIRYNQTVTPYHRMVVFKFDRATGVSSWNDCIMTSDQVKSELERNPTLSIMLPCRFTTIGNNITPDTSKESIVPDNGYIYSSIEDRDTYQKHILETYGLLTYEKDGRIYQSKESLIYYTGRNNNDCTDNPHIGSFSEFDYDGIVWCPNTEAGTAVFRKDGSLFISGNSQAPFTNITLDWIVPDDQKNLPAIVGGKEMDFTYGDCQKEMDMVNKAFIEVMVEGDANGRGLQYPIPTYSITKDFDWSETENNTLLFEMTAKYGIPYFSNYVNSDMNPSDIRSMCCRLRLDLRELRKKGGGFFGSGESTGSVGVVTINLPRLAYKSKTEKEFYERLDHLMDLAARSLKVKRDVITRLMEAGLYPYTKRYLGTFNNHFSTIGLVGMNEAGLNASWLKKDLTHPEVQQFAKDVLNHMRERLSDYQVQYGDLYNLEATPAESTAYRFAKHDKVDYPDIITANMSGTPYYTNSSHLPVGYTEDIFNALDIQDELQTLYTSGTVFHAFLGERLPDWRAAMNLVRKIAENYKLPYYTMSPTYSICREHGYLKGEEHTCPYCGKPTEIYSRITGYYRPVQNWNDGKTQEFKDRRTYNVENSIADESKFLDLPELSGGPLKEFEPFKQILDKEREREARLQRLKDITDAAIAKNTPPELLADLGYSEKRIPNEFSKFADDAISETLGRSATESHCGPDGCHIDFDKIQKDGYEFAKREFDEARKQKTIPILYTTKTCPNCKQVEKILNENGVAYIKQYVEDNVQKVKDLGIRQAPTLVIGKSQYLGLGSIRVYAINHKTT